MRITWMQPSTLPVLCADVPTIKTAHPTMVGFLTAQGASTGGLRFPQPRTTKETNVLAQLPNGVYGTRGSVAKGSQMADALTPVGVKASGVPPRGRPV